MTSAYNSDIHRNLFLGEHLGPPAKPDALQLDAVVGSELGVELSPAEVADAIRREPGLDKYAGLFADHNVSSDILAYLLTLDLKEMGVASLGDRLRIKTWILLRARTRRLVRGVSERVARELLELTNAVLGKLVLELANAPPDQVAAPQLNAALLYEIRKIHDNFQKLKEELLPLVKYAKEHKPLPTPEKLKFGPQASPQLVSFLPNRATHSSNETPAASQTLARPLRNTTVTTPTLVHLPVLGEHSVHHEELQGMATLLLTPLPTPTVANVHYGRPPVKHGFSSASVHTAQGGSRGGSSGSNRNTSAGLPGSNEPLKQLRASTEDPCYKVLQQAMRRHRLPVDDWHKYVLVICYGDQERIIQMEERPVVIFRELRSMGKHPAIMLRMVDDANDGSSSRTPGGKL